MDSPPFEWSASGAEKAPIRLLLVDGHAIVRAALRALCEATQDLKVAGEAATAGEAVWSARGLRPDAVVLDVVLPPDAAVQATRQMLAEDERLKIIALSAYDDGRAVSEMLRAGARAYLMKSLPGSELIRAIRTVATGGAVLDPSVAPGLVAEYRRLAEGGNWPHERLNQHELEALRLLATGLSNAEIAQKKMGLSRQTVSNLLSQLYRKLGVHNRAEAVVEGMARGLISS